MYLGYVETIEAGSARGWVYDRAVPARRLEVELVIDGWPVAQSSVEWDRPDLTILNIGRTDCAFNLRLPMDLVLDVARMGVRVVGSTEMLPLSDQACRATGVVESGGRDFVAGWGWHIGFPRERLLLDVKLDGQVIATGKAELFRDDLLQGGVGDGFYGYRIPITVDEQALAPGRMSVVDRRSGAALEDFRAQPASARPRQPAPIVVAPVATPVAAPVPVAAPAPAPAPEPSPAASEPPRTRVQIEEEGTPVRISREAAEALRQSMGFNDDDVF